MTTFYKKVNNNFVAISESNQELEFSIPFGSYLLTVKNGSHLRVAIDNVDTLPLVAASTHAIDLIAEALYVASTASPETEWHVEWNTAYRIAQETSDTLTDEASKLLTNPTIQAAYDHFLLVCKLSYDADAE